MHLTLVHLIILKKDTVLLLKRQNTGTFDGLYALPGGKCEAGETIEQAAIREAKEELSIIVSRKHIHLLYQSITLSPAHPDITYLNSFVEILDYGGRIQNLEPAKCSELKFYSLSNLPLYMVPFARKGLEKALKAKTH